MEGGIGLFSEFGRLIWETLTGCLADIWISRSGNNSNMIRSGELLGSLG